MSRAQKPGMRAAHLDEGAFQHCCHLFLQHSHMLGDGWTWESMNGSDEGYMKRTVLVTRKAPDPGGHSRLVEDMDTLEEMEDGVESAADGTLADGGRPAVICSEYHVLYSSSFQSPVLYFRASTLDGRPLSLEEIWDNVHSNYRQRLLHGPWETITQQEHPLLGQPFFVLHPCRTQELMTPVLEAAHNQNRWLNYIVSWLSAVGPVVGLDVPLSYATVVTEPKSMNPE